MTRASQTRRARPAAAGRPRSARRLHDGRRAGHAGALGALRRSALTLVRPVARRRLYWTARAVLVSDAAQVKAFDAVFRAVFGVARGSSRTSAATDERAPRRRRTTPRARPPAGAAGRRARRRRACAGDADGADAPEVPVPVAASDEERLRGKRFDALEPGELAQLYPLMTRLELATPLRRTRRAERDRRGEHVDLRRTLRGSLRTGGDPIRLAPPAPARRAAPARAAVRHLAARWSPTRAPTCSS